MKALLSRPLRPDAQVIIVIMAGGSGTRFWPLSRTALPKQFLPLAEEGRTLIQATADRQALLPFPTDTLVVTAEHQRHLVEAQLPDAAILAEPAARNTAPCLGFAAQAVLETIGDRVLLCLPADHLIHGEEALKAAFLLGIETAQKQPALVTFGIHPTHPETGYGYIQAGAPTFGSKTVFSVTRFVEKPSREKAVSYLAAGGFYWNSGMFAWKASLLLDAIERALPPLALSLKKLATASPAQAREIFASIDPISVDHGVMERATNVAMVGGVGFQWSDVGSWSSWLESSGAGEENLTKGDSVLLDSDRSAIISTGRFVAGVGLEDIIVVETKDAVLVCHRSHSQEVKNIVDLLREHQRHELL